MTDATETPDTLAAALKDQLRWLCTLFGQPSDLMRVLAVTEWRRLRVWVRGVEALAAQLVRALAATLAPSAAPRAAAPGRPATRTAPVTDYPDSAHWAGVSVRLRNDEPSGATAQISFSSARRAAIQAEQPEMLAGFRSAHRLALRLEAVIRVAEHAHRYARRLARRVAQPQRRRRTRSGEAMPPDTGDPHMAPLGPTHPPPPIETG